MIVITIPECSQNEKRLIGIYSGSIYYCEEGKDTVTVRNVFLKLTIFTDEIPTSSMYRAKLEIDTFTVVGVPNPWRKTPDLIFPSVTTEHNIDHKDGQYLLRMGETTADFGFPIPYPIQVDGIIDYSYSARISMKIAASFGLKKEFVFEGNQIYFRSIPVKIKNLTSSLEKPVPIDVF
ncbi:MAG: hypothetical protein LBV74_12865 [Tannerella sp.]|jgi:hypothetical protein|nr:hypothetical protein [Tannerella sp.]